MPGSDARKTWNFRPEKSPRCWVISKFGFVFFCHNITSSLWLNQPMFKNISPRFRGENSQKHLSCQHPAPYFVDTIKLQTLTSTWSPWKLPSAVHFFPCFFLLSTPLAAPGVFSLAPLCLLPTLPVPAVWELNVPMTTLSPIHYCWWKKSGEKTTWYV